MQILLDNEITPVCGSKLGTCCCLYDKNQEGVCFTNILINKDQCHDECCKPSYESKYKYYRMLEKDDSNKIKHVVFGICGKINMENNYHTGIYNGIYAFEYPSPDD